MDQDESNKMLEAMGGLYKIAFTSLIAMNGMAIISLLTFIGNSKFIQRFSNLWFWAISSYCVGLFFILLSIAFAFWAQKLFREGTDADTKDGRDTDDKIKNKLGIIKRNLAICFFSISLFAFLAGCIFSICAISASFG